jgi:hypothetical protein
MGGSGLFIKFRKRYRKFHKIPQKKKLNGKKKKKKEKK